jgi:hypothetical protein
MLLDLFGGLLLPNVQTGWKVPSTALLFDAESVFLRRQPEHDFLELVEQARKLLRLTHGNARAAADALIGEDSSAVGARRTTIDNSSAGLLDMLTEFRCGNFDVLGASTRFTAFGKRSTFGGIPVDLPTPLDPISAMHAVYNHICGILPGCRCMPGGGTLARTEVLVALMNVVLSRYPYIYGEDALFTVLAEQLGLRMHLTTQVQVTNRCPALGERLADTGHDAWVAQFAKWYRGFHQIENLYGSEPCQSIVGPTEQDVLAAGIAIAACRYRAKGDAVEALRFLEQLAATQPVLATIHEMAKRAAP